MNILYVGMYRQADGWGYSSRNTVESLFRTGHNIAIRPVYLNRYSRYTVTDERFLAAECEDFGSYDAVIQHVLPDYFVRNTRFGRNIGFFHSETKNLVMTGWPQKCQLMDDIWVSSRQESLNITDDGNFVTPVNVIPMGFDTEKYSKVYQPLEIPDAKRTFNFYTIADFTERKNLDDLVTAFHLSFGPEDPVKLIIKSGGNDSLRVETALNTKCQSVKDKLRTRKLYSREILVTGHFKESDINGLHQMCHCFVLPSYGESVCIPMVDAIGFGKRAIVTSETGMSSYVSAPHWDEEVHPQVEFIDASWEPVLTNNPPLPHIYSANEQWRKPSVLDLACLMQYVYLTRNEPHHKSKVTSYQESASYMNEVFNAV